jgi:tetraprenyl-beta-curcumene synthase
MHSLPFGRVPILGESTDSIPLSPRQARVLLAAATRQLVWGLWAVSCEIKGWRRRALAIPDVSIRADALDALSRKRTHVDGAALFWILPDNRDPRLLRLLVAYEIALEFLDNAHEHETSEINGRQLHRALVEALDPNAPISDYYLHHPRRDDGGYLRSLVEVCREGCAAMPSYTRARELLLLCARRCGDVQSLNHNPDPVRRSVALRDWAKREFPDMHEVSWWELTAAASSSVVVHALLALTACASEDDLSAVDVAYAPWICAASTMLDSYVDRARDIVSGDHSYVGHYPNADVGGRRMCELVRRSAREARSLHKGHRHALILASMVAMYMSSDSARTPAMRATTNSLIQAGGSLTKLLVPILRCWRTVYSLRSA